MERVKERHFRVDEMQWTEGSILTAWVSERQAQCDRKPTCEAMSSTAPHTHPSITRNLQAARTAEILASSHTFGEV